MNKNSYKCYPPKRKPKRRCSGKKLGMLLIAMGLITVFMLFLPLECWVVIMCAVLMICGFMLIKSSR